MSVGENKRANFAKSHLAPGIMPPSRKFRSALLY